MTEWNVILQYISSMALDQSLEVTLHEKQALGRLVLLKVTKSNIFIKRITTLSKQYPLILELI